MQASANGHVAVVTLLLKHNARVDTQDTVSNRIDRIVLVRLHRESKGLPLLASHSLLLSSICVISRLLSMFCLHLLARTHGTPKSIALWSRCGGRFVATASSARPTSLTRRSLISFSCVASYHAISEHDARLNYLQQKLLSRCH